MEERSIIKIRRLIGMTIAILFVIVSLDVIHLGFSYNSIETLGFPYRQKEIILAFSRAPIASRLTIIIIFLIFVDGLIKILKQTGKENIRKS